jgi:hypothetical protein
MSLQNQRRVSVRINGVDTGVWDKRSGAEVDSAEKKYNPGGKAKPISLGGKQEIGALNCSRLFELSRDLPKIKGWMALAGRATPIVIIELFLDENDAVVDTGLTYKGTLKKVMQPDHDSESDEEAMVELEATITDIS